MSRVVLRWIEERTGLPGAVRRFLNEEVPASAGWPQVFGSIVLFLFLTQVFTGVLLSFNYAPAPGDAYRSLVYIMSEVTGGRIVRGLHHWGSSMMIGAVVIHMIQVFLYGAYKKPREATWIVGVTLLLITLGFGLTGYLLPWDNRAYWGTVVTTQIAGQTPILGGYLLKILGAAHGVGAVTFAHFYALHTVLLPMFAFLLVAFHIYLVRRHGVAPAPIETGLNRRFFPEQLFKDACAIFVVFAVLFLLAAAGKAPLEVLADPTDTSYVPRPEWYFLFLFETLKFLRGASERIGSVLLPTIAVAALMAVPFLDRSRLKRVRERTLAIATVAVCSVTGVSLTIAAVLTTPRSSVNASAAGEWSRMTPSELAGYAYFREARCSNCHNLVDGQPKPGPNLAELAVIKPVSQITAHFGDQAGPMGGVTLSPARMQDISAFLRRLTPDNAGAFQAAPEAVIRGAQVFSTNSCATCHTVNGAGGAMGPSLNGVSQRRSRDWIAQHLRDPKSQTPGTIMPSFQLEEKDRDWLILYLSSLPGG